MHKPSPSLRAVALALVVLPLAAFAEAPKLIPREVLFGNPERTSPQLSPDAKRIAWLAPDDKNVLQVWVKSVGADDAKMVTKDKKRGIRQYFWAWDDKTLVYLQDLDGDENWHLYGVDLVSGNVRDLTPFQDVRATVVDYNPSFPNELLVGLNARKREVFDVYRLDLRTGALTLDTENPGDVAGWATDAKMVVRGASVTTADGGTELRVRASKGAPWKKLLTAGPDEIVALGGFTPDGKAAYLMTSVGTNTARLVERNLATGKEKRVADHAKVDVTDYLTNPKDGHVEAVAFTVGRTEWTVVDPKVKGDFEAFAKLENGEPFVRSRDRSDTQWIVGFDQDQAPTKFYQWDRTAKKGTFLFSVQPKLEQYTLAPMQHVVIPSRDGLELHSYLTLPVGVPAKNLPMVLMVHGGPWGRDSWGLRPDVQWLANRGYAVLQTNFRASFGFGKAFLNAGDRQWGLKMHDDLIDAVDWAVKQGYADPKKVAIMGGSYGGYAALAGAAFTPDTFRCAVDIVGPSNLFTLLKSIPPYWKPTIARMHRRMGNPDDPKDEEVLRKASPLFSADKIKIPLLIGQGANDPRVKQAESEQIFAAAEKKGIKTTYVVYTDEGHGFRRPENRLDFNARVEAFLAQYLGGRVEPMQGDKMPGSTAQVRVAGGASAATASQTVP